MFVLNFYHLFFRSRFHFTFLWCGSTDSGWWNDWHSTDCWRRLKMWQTSQINWFHWLLMVWHTSCKNVCRGVATQLSSTNLEVWVFWVFAIGELICILLFRSSWSERFDPSEWRDSLRKWRTTLWTVDRKGIVEDVPPPSLSRFRGYSKR